jgi:prophage tail gpP-like protein
VFDFFDRLARMRQSSIGSDHEGNTLLIGKHTGRVGQELVEGINILKMQCIFSNEEMGSMYALKGQKQVNDDEGMRPAAEMKTMVPGTLPIFRYIEIPVENPLKSVGELKMRNLYEAIKREGTLIRAYVTVQGWLRDGLTLWRAGDDVGVYSPMAMLEMIMKIQTATFTQDNKGGTTTTLELVLPWKLEDQLYGELAPKPPSKASDASDEVIST